VAVSASGLYENRGLLEYSGSWTKNVCRTPIANRGRSIEWSSYFCYASPPSGGFRFRSFFGTTKIGNNLRSVAAGREMSKNTNSKPGSVYRMLKILLLRVATWTRFPLPVVITTTKLANNSRTVAAGRETSTEHQ
jgi:hypothetical protein